jgi:DNA-binding beta-propeller fold protein YncE
MLTIDRRRKVMLSRLVVVVAVAGLVVATPTAWAERLLGLAQLAEGSGCIAQPEDADAEAIGGCGRGKGLIDANHAAVAADGAGVYVAAAGSNAVASFAREPATGKLRQVNCVSANATSGVDGTKGACADGNALAGAAAVAVSPDGKNVYAAAYASGGIAIFARNAETAGLRQIGCVRAVRTCTSARALAGAASVAVSPDGRNVYLASAEADAVVSFSRDAATGLLAPLGCISDDGTDRLCLTGNALKGAYSIVVAPDGKNVYVAAFNSNAVLTFDRDAANGRLTQRGCILSGAPARGSCVAGHALESPVDVAVTQDGSTVFAAALDSNAVVVFARNRTTGALAEIGCVSEVDDGEDDVARDGCAHVRPLYGANSVAVSPNGTALYVTHNAGLTVFGRDRTTGALSRSACVTHRGYWDEETTAGCTLASGVADPSSVAVSPDGSNVYVTAYGSDAITTFKRGVFVAQPAALISRRLMSVRVGCPGTHAGACAGRVVLIPPPALRRLRQSVAYRLEPGRSGIVHLHLRRDLVVALRRAPLAVVVSVTDSVDLAPVKRLLVLRTAKAKPGDKPSRSGRP